MARHFTIAEEKLSPACQGAQAILSKTYDACESFHVIFRQLQQTAGISSDSQEDTLRAMLVFACAGLDSTIKLLVRDALHAVIDIDPGAQANFTESVRRRLPDMDTSRDLLATVLTAPSPRFKLIERWTADLLADSLQSIEQLSKVASAFNMNLNGLFDFPGLSEACLAGRVSKRRWSGSPQWRLKPTQASFAKSARNSYTRSSDNEH